MSLQEFKKYEGFNFELNKKLLDLLMRMICVKPKGSHSCSLRMPKPSKSSSVAPKSTSTADDKPEDLLPPPPSDQCGTSNTEKDADVNDVDDVYVCESCRLLVRFYEQVCALVELIVSKEPAPVSESQLPTVSEQTFRAHVDVAMSSKDDADSQSNLPDPFPEVG